MIVLKNKAKRVLVLKAYGQPVLRLLPGLNQVDMKDLSPYFEGNPAAEAMVKENVAPVDGTLSTTQKAEARAAKQKNDTLNKNGVLLKQANERLAEAAAKGKDGDKEIATLRRQLKAQGKALEKAMGAIDKMVLNAAKKAVVDAQSALDATKNANAPEKDQTDALQALEVAQKELDELEGTKDGNE